MTVFQPLIAEDSAEPDSRPHVPGLGVWEHFGLNDGLPDLSVESLLIDRQGALWAGTHDRGVARYDGERFDVFTRRDGLAGDAVRSILEDREGALWFGTSGGLTRYADGQFTSVLPVSGEKCSFLGARCVRADGTLWFGVQHLPGETLSVCRWDGERLERVPIEGSERLSHSGVIRQMAADTLGNIWCGGDVVYLFDGREFLCIAGESDELGYVTALLPRLDGSLWIACSKGLFVRAGGRIEVLQEECTSNTFVAALLEGPGETVHATTFNGGLLSYAEGRFQLLHKLDVQFGGSLCRDSAGRFWVNTNGRGLYCYDSTSFEIFRMDHGLPSNGVTCLTSDSAGRHLWIGTENGLARYDGSAFSKVEGIKSTTMRSLLRDRRDDIWIGTGWGDLYRHDGDTLHCVMATPEIEGARYLASLAEDRDGRIWFGYRAGYGFGYCSEGQVVNFRDDRDGAYPAFVKGLLVDRSGTLWIGSWHPGRWEGVCRYDGERFAASRDANECIGGAVHALGEDRDGNIWIGTSAGVCRNDGTHFRAFTHADGLPHEIVTVITQTTDGTLWFGTSGGGVSRYDGKVFQVVTIPGDAGLNTVRSIHQDPRGWIWFGTDGGLVHYTSQREQPTVKISAVLADQHYESPSVLELPTTAGRIGIRFQGSSSVCRRAHLVYRFRLEGYELEWRQTRNRQIDYPPLAPGNYRFVVQAVDRDLNYSSAAAVHLTVTADPRIVGLADALRAGGASGEFVGSSPALARFLAHVRDVAPTELAVLISGETGVGKGMVARAIHGLSARREGPFIQVNCSALPEGLAESELFGHERGAFTGAVARRLGRVELAEGGTLFLDEVGDLSMGIQAKLLRVLEEQTFERVGGESVLQANIRIVAATNRHLEAMVAEEGFRQDLYYRLRAFPIEVPPLRDRRQDIPILVQYFAERFASHLDRPLPDIPPEVVAYLKDYDWPGNVRELDHVVQRAILLCKGTGISLEDAKGLFGRHADSRDSQACSPLDKEGQRHVEEERRCLREALDATGWVIYGPRGAAERLGMHPERLRARMKKLGLRRQMKER